MEWEEVKRAESLVNDMHQGHIGESYGHVITVDGVIEGINIEAELHELSKELLKSVGYCDVSAYLEAAIKMLSEARKKGDGGFTPVRAAFMLVNLEKYISEYFWATQIQGSDVPTKEVIPF